MSYKRLDTERKSWKLSRRILANIGILAVRVRYGVRVLKFSPTTLPEPLRLPVDLPASRANRAQKANDF